MSWEQGLGTLTSSVPSLTSDSSGECQGEVKEAGGKEFVSKLDMFKSWLYHNLAMTGEELLHIPSA